jgi:hypothetical protein
MILTGLAGVVLLLIGLQHAARVVRPHAPAPRASAPS